ncbi:hypothetical protein PENNAL_c0428G01590, partial [Penicillium nalgiovense]
TSKQLFMAHQQDLYASCIQRSGWASHHTCQHLHIPIRPLVCNGHCYYHRDCSSH